MKPHRLTLTNALVLGYGLDKQIHYMFDPRPATEAELTAYHDSDYIDFLSRKVDVPMFSSWDKLTFVEHNLELHRKIK